MIRYYEKMYEEAENKVKRTIPKRPLRLKILSGFVLGVFITFIVLIVWVGGELIASLEFLHTTLCKNLSFWIVVLLILMVASGFLNYYLNKKWRSKTITKDIETHVKYCRNLKKELEKYKIIKLGQYENILSEMSQIKNEYIKKEEKVNSFIYKDWIGLFISIFVVILKDEELNAKLFYMINLQLSSSQLIILLLAIFGIIYGIVLLMSDFYFKKITYYKDIVCNIQIIIDDMKGYYSDIKSDTT